MTDRMTTARDTLTKAAATFREYEAHHMDRALQSDDKDVATAAMGKAARNRDMAVECEAAANLLAAE